MPVLVVGAGPTGLTLALELARRDVPCRIVDRLIQPLAWERATEIHARTMEIFEDQGVIERFLDRGIRCPRVAFYRGGRLIGATSVAGIESNYPFELAIDEPATERFLTERLAELGVTVQRGSELVELQQNDDGVAARLRHPAGDEEPLTAMWAVGCEGAHSVVRHAMGDTFDGITYAHFPIAIDGVVHNWPLPDAEYAIVLSPDNFGSQPLPGGLRRIWWDLVAEHDPDEEEVQAVLDRNVGQGVALGDEIARSRFRLHNRICRHFRANRLFVAGDAAHLCSPMGGHGMNTGIHDAYNLAWKLAAVIGGAPEELLDSYDAERRPVATTLLAADRELMALAQLRDPEACYRRDRTLSIQSADPVWHAEAAARLSELWVSYRNSPVVKGHRRADGEWLGPAPGDRVPDAGPLTTRDGARISIHPLLHGTHHQLLLFAGGRLGEVSRAWAALRKVAGPGVRVHAVVPGDVVSEVDASTGQVLIDEGWSVHDRFGVVGCELLAVRPDGYVGFRSDNPDVTALTAYLTRVHPSP